MECTLRFLALHSQSCSVVIWYCIFPVLMLSIFNAPSISQALLQSQGYKVSWSCQSELPFQKHGHPMIVAAHLTLL